MTDYTAPPDQFDLVLKSGDTLTVLAGGIANDTTINSGARLVVDFGGVTLDSIIKGGLELVRPGGIANDTTIDGGIQDVSGASNRTTINGGTEGIYRGGRSSHTTVNAGGVEKVHADGTSYDTTINTGGVETIESDGTLDGRSFRTTINDGGVEKVNAFAQAVDTTINTGGVEHVSVEGVALNITFGSVGGLLELERPSGLSGTITNWHVGDVIDLLHSPAVRAFLFGNELQVTDLRFGGTTYTLVGQQPDTEVTTRSDGHGGTDLILTPIVGQAAQTETLHHLA